MDLITRAEAQQQGLKRYYTGVPCKYGHLSEKHVSSRACLECQRVKSQSPEGKEYLRNYYLSRADDPAFKAAAAERNAKRYEEKRESINAANAVYRENNREKMAAIRKSWKQRNPEKVAEHRRKNYLAKRDDRIAYEAAYRINRYHADPGFAIVVGMRNRLTRLLAGNPKATTTTTTMELIGCTREELVAHIEAQFLPGMSWENRSEWTIDHRLPCAAFDMLNPVHQRACFHYTNLQPLWSKDNLSKGDKHDPAEVAAWLARFS